MANLWRCGCRSQLHVVSIVVRSTAGHPEHDDLGQILDSDKTVLLCLHQWGAHDHRSLASPIVRNLAIGCYRSFAWMVLPKRVPSDIRTNAARVSVDSSDSRQHPHTYPVMNSMRPVLHLLSVGLLVPGMVLAGAFMILGNAIATPSLLGFFGALLKMAVWMIPWGLLGVCAAFLILALGGMSARFRWLAGLCVALLATGSSALLLTLTIAHDNFSAAQLFFLVPAIVAASVGIWFAVSEWPLGKSSSPTP